MNIKKTNCTVALEASLQSCCKLQCGGFSFTPAACQHSELTSFKSQQTHTKHTSLPSCCFFCLFFWIFFCSLQDYSNFKVTAPVSMFTWLTHSRVWLCPAKVTQSCYMPVEPQTRAALGYHSELCGGLQRRRAGMSHPPDLKFLISVQQNLSLPIFFLVKRNWKVYDWSYTLLLLLMFLQRLPVREKKCLDKIQFKG